MNITTASTIVIKLSPKEAEMLRHYIQTPARRTPAKTKQFLTELCTNLTNRAKTRIDPA